MLHYLAEPRKLEELIEIIRSAKEKYRNIYINTSLNMSEEKSERALRFLNSALENNLIRGISVSIPYVDISTNSKGYRLLKRFLDRKDCGSFSFSSIRINSIVSGNEDANKIRRFTKDIFSLQELNYELRAIFFRKDYTTCTQANLNSCEDPFFKTLMSMDDLYYKGSGGCLVCRNDTFWPDEKDIKRVIYHRGTERTSTRYGDLMVINDIVVKQDGEIRYDWNEGTILPKRIIKLLSEDRLLKYEDHKDDDSIFSHDIVFQEGLTEQTCRDYDMRDRCRL